jgi:hypothetical protein
MNESNFSSPGVIPVTHASRMRKVIKVLRVPTDMIITGNKNDDRLAVKKSSKQGELHDQK